MSLTTATCELRLSLDSPATEGTVAASFVILRVLFERCSVFISAVNLLLLLCCCCKMHRVIFADVIFCLQGSEEIGRKVQACSPTKWQVRMSD